MADKVLCDKSDLVNIADAVRSKLGVTNTYYVSELSSAIQNIQTGGITPSGTISITENGTVDVSQYANAEVNVSATPSLQSKSVTYTENGSATVTPDAGYDGLSNVDVMVNVAGSGGGGVESPITLTTENLDGISTPIIVSNANGDAFMEITSDGVYTIPAKSIVIITSGFAELKATGFVQTVSGGGYELYGAGFLLAGTNNVKLRNIGIM